MPQDGDYIRDLEAETDALLAELARRREEAQRLSKRGDGLEEEVRKLRASLEGMTAKREELAERLRTVLARIEAMEKSVGGRAGEQRDE